MSTETLKSYIATFREWLDGHATRALEGDDAKAMANWREDLAAAERLLDVKPELPIAFLGPSQQGKSSLINALLGQPILAVGGAVGACTCVITSVHYHPHNHYRAEIDFISLADWRVELAAIAEALSAQPFEEDTDQDRDEREESLKAAREKMDAVYREVPDRGVAEILADARLRLPEDIARRMNTGEPLIIQVENARTLRDKVKQYLVGRHQHPDAQFWPLISRVRIYGKFEVLGNGVVLVDLPGLNDPNPAREQVTKKYLQDAHYIWLVCNSQVGIDRIFTNILRNEGLLLRLFLAGRLDAFSVIATQIDHVNLQAVLEQMGVSVEDFDGDVLPVLGFRRQEIYRHVQNHLLAIARDIAANAAGGRQNAEFLERVQSIPVFAVSAAAYLHAVNLNPLFQGMKLSAQDTHIPQLIEHLHTITLEQSHKSQVAAASKRLSSLFELVQRFFFDRIRRIELDGEEARREWDKFVEEVTKAIEKGRRELKKVQARSEETLQLRCEEFERRLAELDACAITNLKEVFASWDPINWKTLRSIVKSGGVWRNYKQQQFNLNFDVVQAYLKLVPLVWDEFFRMHLSALIGDASDSAHDVLRMTAERITGSMAMLRHQPDRIRDSMDKSLQTAEESFQLRAGQTLATLATHIRQTRETLSTGMVEAAFGFMQPAYQRAAAEPIGEGIKRKMLHILVQHASQYAPRLFINMRQDLVEGVTALKSSMKRQLSKIITYGESVLDHYERNVLSHQFVAPTQRPVLEAVLSALPQFGGLHRERLPQEVD